MYTDTPCMVTSGIAKEGQLMVHNGSALKAICCLFGYNHTCRKATIWDLGTLWNFSENSGQRALKYAHLQIGFEMSVRSELNYSQGRWRMRHYYNYSQINSRKRGNVMWRPIVRISRMWKWPYLVSSLKVWIMRNDQLAGWAASLQYSSKTRIDRI